MDIKSINNFTIKILKDCNLGNKKYSKNKYYRCINGRIEADDGFDDFIYASYNDFAFKKQISKDCFELVNDAYNGVQIFNMLFNKEIPENTIVYWDYGKYIAKWSFSNKTILLFEEGKYNRPIELGDLLNKCFTIENEVDWKNISKMTKVQVRNSLQEEWTNAYFLGCYYENLNSYTFRVTSLKEKDEFTGISPEDMFSSYTYCRLYKEEN